MALPKFIYFDVGGVLLHFMHIRQHLADAWGISLADYLAVHKLFEPDLAEGKADESMLEAEFVKQFKLELPPGFFANCDWVGQFRPISEMHALVKDLAPHYRLGLLTNVSQRVYAKAQQFPEMYPAVPFEFRVKSYEVGIAKPDKRIYEYAVLQTGLQPSEVFFVDDMLENVQSAATAGLQTFQFDPNQAGQKTHELRQLLLSEFSTGLK